jgi:hypothetical protein
LLAAAWLLAFASPALAQEPALELNLSRDFGYAGFEGDIEGLYSLSAEGPADLERVDFYIDATLLASVEAEPFRYQFTTKDFAPGAHTLSAIGFTASGSELHSNEFSRVFLSAEEARGKIGGLIGPLFAIIAGIMAITIVVPMLFGRKKPQPGKYGFSGGAVCPKCELPFPLHFFNIHMGARNLERCPHCGKWVWVRRADKAALSAAEARWQGSEMQAPGAPASNRLDEQIDDSRYER